MRERYPHCHAASFFPPVKSQCLATLATVLSAIQAPERHLLLKGKIWLNSGLIGFKKVRMLSRGVKNPSRSNQLLV